jgi:uncharacterized spore protein YtfJ
MESEIQRLLDTVAELQKKANVNAAFGEPVTIEGHTVIPVAKVTYGFGIGLGHGAIAGTEAETEEDVAKDVVGSGGGVQTRPMAIIEVTPESTWVEPIVDEQKLALAGSLLAGWGIFWLALTLIKIFGRQK